mmetsp:Transcript_46392/g.104572  ORF Transcript_46392/g.104572 Transcript_46392/m.104572 type:complete len:86 (-) Transcript_46392:139-396(-)
MWRLRADVCKCVSVFVSYRHTMLHGTMLKHVARALADLTNAYLSSYWPYLCIAYVSLFGTYFFCIMNQDQSPSTHSHGHGRDFAN